MTIRDDIKPIPRKELTRAEVLELLPYLEATRKRAIRFHFPQALALADCIGSLEDLLEGKDLK